MRTDLIILSLHSFFYVVTGVGVWVPAFERAPRSGQSEESLIGSSGEELPDRCVECVVRPAELIVEDHAEEGSERSVGPGLVRES